MSYGKNEPKVFEVQKKTIPLEESDLGVELK